MVTCFTLLALFYDYVNATNNLNRSHNGTMPWEKIGTGLAMAECQPVLGHCHADAKYLLSRGDRLER